MTERKTLMETYQGIFQSMKNTRLDKVNPIHVAERILVTPLFTPKLYVQQEQLLRSYLTEASDVLDELIDAYAQPKWEEHIEDDAEYNDAVYRGLIVEWNALAQTWVNDYDYRKDDDGVIAITIRQAVDTLIGQDGLLNLLAGINFEIPEEELAELRKQAEERATGE